MTLAEDCWKEIVPLIIGSDDLDADSNVIDIIQKYLDQAANQERPMKTHNLKSWTDAFEPVWEGRKRHEYRLNDRGFAEGDELFLQEYDPAEGQYLERSLRVKVTYINYGPGFEIPKDYCVMSISEPYDRKG